MTLTKRIIPCLDVKDGNVVKGIRFGNHEKVGDILERADYYNRSGADEMVFYDITASSENRVVDYQWIRKVAKNLNIPFCVAGGIKTVKDAEMILNAGADKISINSPAIENPKLITLLSKTFGAQCIVIGIDSLKINNQYKICQYTGSQKTLTITDNVTTEWIKEVQDRGAGEIVLNCMDQDGIRQGYDIVQLNLMRDITHVPLIASGGAGSAEHFRDVFKNARVDGALAASIFHKNILPIRELKTFLTFHNLNMRI